MPSFPNSCSTYVPPNPKPGKPPLTDTAPPLEDPEAAARRERHLRICQRMADLAMDLADIAAARMREERAAELQAATAALPPLPAPPRRTCDPTLAFARFTHIARQAVALEMRVAEGPTRSRARAERPQPAPPHPKLLADKRRGPAREALVMLTKKHPDRAKIIKIAHDRLDQELLADTETEIAELLQKFCSDIGIVCDLGRLPDHVLGIDPSTWPPLPPPEPFLWPRPRPP